MTQYGFAFIGTRCTGCKTCVLACKDYYNLDVDITYRRVYEYGGGTCRIDEQGLINDTSFVYHVSSACNHCVEPVCVDVCPTGAMNKDADTGLVSVDGSRCVGCGYCTMACPYGNPQINKETGQSGMCQVIVGNFFPHKINHYNIVKKNIFYFTIYQSCQV